MGVLGQFANGPIQFGNAGQIEQRGTIDSPDPSATGSGTTGTISSAPDTVPGAAPGGGGVIPTASGPTQGQYASNANTKGGFLLGPATTTANPGATSAGGIPLGQMSAPWDTNISGGGGAAAQAGDQWIGAGGALPTVLGFDDGGAVDPNDESDGTNQQGSGTLDPMSFVKQAAAYGRQKMGLPTNFSTGEMGGAQQPGFDDGGVVPDQQPQQGQQGQGNPSAVNPQSAIKYLSGDGAVSPDIAHALEQHVDPQGQMDPAERTMATMQKAPSDEARFGMLQHYRTMYNGFSAGARAAMDKNNPGQAALLATQAFDHTPTGMKVHFAPAQGGIAVSARKLGGGAAPQQQGYAGGGPVDDSGNLVQRSAPDGRGVMDDYDEADYTQGGRGNGNMPDSASRIARTMPEGAAEGIVDHVNQAEPSTNIEDRRGESGFRSAVRNVTGYDGGGEVQPDQPENDDGTSPSPDQGVIPSEASPEGASPAGDAAPPPPSDDTAAGDQPTTHVLTPQQFKALMQSGFDKPIDDGVGETLTALGPITNASGQPFDFNKAPVAGPDNPLGASKRLQAQSDEPLAQAQKEAVDATSQVENPGAKPAAPADADKTKRQGRYDEQLDRAEKLASKLFPWASQTDQRNAYVAKQMDAFEHDIAAKTEGGKNDTANNVRLLAAQEATKRSAAHDDAVTARQTTGIQSKQEFQKAQQAFQSLDHTQRQQVEMLVNQIKAAPTATPEDIQAAVKSHAKFLGMDQQVMSNLVQMLQQRGGQQQQSPQQGSLQTQSQPHIMRTKDGHIYQLNQQTGQYDLKQ